MERRGTALSGKKTFRRERVSPFPAQRSGVNGKFFRKNILETMVLKGNTFRDGLI